MNNELFGSLQKSIRQVFHESGQLNLELFSDTGSRYGANLNQIAEKLQRLVDVIDKLKSISMRNVSVDTLRQLVEHLTSMWAPISLIHNESFDPGRPVNEQVNRSIELFRNEFQSRFDKFVLIADSAIAVSKSLEFEKRKEELDAALAKSKEAESRFHEKIKYLEDTIQNAEETRSQFVKLREESKQLNELLKGNVTIEQADIQSGLFDKAATDHRKWARVWLFVVVVALGIVSLTYWQLFADSKIDEEITTQELTHLIVIKFFFVVISVSVLVWSSRIYKVHKHLQTTNAHRSRAMRAFQYLYSGSLTDSTKDKIVIEAAHAIFRSVPTGYFIKDSQNVAFSIGDLIKKE